MQCPTCGNPTKWEDNPSRPFCSERCKVIDLGRWASEEYKVPSEPAPQLEIDERTPGSDHSENQEAE
jgi:hypothetical protein